MPLVVNAATVSGGGDSNPDNNRDIDPTPVGGTGRLVVEKQVSPTEAEVGDVVDYTITIRNVGTGDLHHVRVEDTLPAGLSYVAGSSRLDGIRVPDPDGAPGPSLRFEIGDVMAGQSRRLLYRVEVRAGAELGSGTNLAFAGTPDDSSGGSNVAEATLKIRNVTFADEGILIGKVFVDCDCDTNGIQGAEELGIPGVRLYLEDGSSAITDSEGKYSFANLRPRLHVVRIDASTLPAAVDLKSLSNRDAGDPLSRFVDLTKGELHRADFATRTCAPTVLAQVKTRRRLGEITGPSPAGQPGLMSGSALQPLSRPPLGSLLLVGVLDGRLDWRSLKAGELYGVRRDAFDDLLQDATFDRDHGRLRGAGRGALFAKGDIGHDLLLTLRYDSERDPSQRRFRDLRPEEGFDLFGDASIHEFDARSTSRLYARIDRGASYAMFGDFVTPTSDLRQLGAFTRSLNGAVVHAEGRSGAVSGFGTQARERQVVDEIAGRGVSGPYALSRPDGVVGTEIVEILVRDRNQPSRVLSRERKVRFVDYTLEPFTGRLLFRQPVPSLDEHLDPVSIRALYEVQSAGAGYGVYGGEATLTASQRVTFGVAASRDEDPATPRGLASAQLALRPVGGLVLTGEVAHSDSGGALFDGQRKAEAWRSEARFDQGGFGAHAFVQRSDPHFDNASAGILSGREELGADARLQAGGSWLNGRALRTEDLIGGGRRDGLDAAAGRRFGRLSAEAGYRWAHETTLPATPPMTGIAPNSVSAVRGRLSTELPAVTPGSIFAEYEKDVEQSRADRLALGGDVHVTPHARLYARHENLASLAGPFAINDQQEQATTLVGFASDEARDGSVFSEYRARDAFAGRDIQAAMGLRNRWQVRPGLRVDGSLEHVEVIRGGAGDATSVTGGLEYTRDPLWKGTARVEFRTQSSVEQWLASGSAARKLSRDWTGLAQSTWFWTPDEARMDERSRLGLAWRQTDRDAWDALGRYEHRLERVGHGTDPFKRATHIVAGDLNWHPAQGWTLAGQSAAKWHVSERSGSRVSTDAQLFGARAMVDVTRRLDFGLIGRGLFSHHFDARQSGLGAELGGVVTRDLRLAVGYNVFGVRDAELTSGECTDRGPYVRFGLKFGDGWFGGARRRADDGATRPLGFAGSPALADRAAAPEGASAVAPTALTPLGHRMTDEAIARDLAAIDAWQARLAGLPGTPQDPWRAEAARGWLDVARVEYTDNDETGFAEGAFALGTSLIEAIESGVRPARPGEVPPAAMLPGSPRARADLWAELERLKQSPGFSCAAEDLARMEIELAWAGNEQVNQGDCISSPHLDEAERLVRKAGKAAADCAPLAPPVVTPSPEPAPSVPVLPPLPDLSRIPRDVHFAFDRCELGPLSQEIVRQIADAMKSRPSLRLRLEGFTDVRGTNAYNEGLSACRICAVRSLLEELGIDGSRIVGVPRGEASPVSLEQTRRAHALNRRVEMTLLDENGRALPADSQREDLRIEAPPRPGARIPRVAAPRFPRDRTPQCSL